MGLHQGIRNTPTGRKGVCSLCGALVEEVRFMHGVWQSSHRYSPGFVKWRSVDGGHAATRCGGAVDGPWHEVTVADGSSFAP